MYTFTDRNEESLTLRPEGTAGVVRACLEHGLIHNQIRKFWYLGPMFRHERPQMGRYRQFYQFDAEIFGIATPDVEAETLSMLVMLWQELRIDKHVRLEINSIGTLEERQQFREALIDFLTPLKADLDEDSERRLSANPLRILDSKDPKTQALLKNAPTLSTCLGEPSCSHFEALKSYLEALHIPYHVNPHLVRGLDYYGHTVFEWTTDVLGAQATVCAGGRYDGLVSELGGSPTPAFGFAMGIERLILLLQKTQFQLKDATPQYFIGVEEGQMPECLVLLQGLRRQGISAALATGGGSFKSQMKRADKSGAQYLIQLRGTDCLAGHSHLRIKDLRAHHG
jgi:histidyl-tRNA synthetase